MGGLDGQNGLRPGGAGQGVGRDQWGEEEKKLFRWIYLSIFCLLFNDLFIATLRLCPFKKILINARPAECD
jgi:hypothetical protein